MKKNLTELVFILDSSGSMSHLTGDTIGGFNSMLKKQKAEKGEALVSTVVFNDESMVVHDRVDIAKVYGLDMGEYCPGGGTALLDAIGGAIHHIGNVHKYARAEDVPERTVFIITTDGMENSSRKYNQRMVKEMIERQKREYGWEFIFLGANIDAIKVAEDIGIRNDRAANFVNDDRGTALNFDVLSEMVCNVRAEGKIHTDWKQKIDSDFATRKAKK